LYFEGTGAMALDHDNNLAYTIKSKRMSEELLKEFYQDFQYEPVMLNASG
jgi:hypothetical protein